MTKTNEIKSVKSINTKLIGSTKIIKENLNKPLLQIQGIIVDTFSTVSKYGEQTGFRGSFFARNVLTDELFESNAMFLPNSITDNLISKLKTMEFADLEMAIEVRATETDKNAQGYAFCIEAPKTEKQVNYAKQMRENILKGSAFLLENK